MLKKPVMSEHETILNELSELRRLVSGITEPDKILTLQKAAELLGVKPKTLSRTLAKGELKYYKPEGCKMVYLKTSDINEWLERGAVNPSGNVDALAALEAIRRTRK